MNLEEYERMYRFEDTYWWFVARRDLVLQLIKQAYPGCSDLRILDIGCGTGAMLDNMSGYGDVVGADFSEEALKFCRERNRDTPLVRSDACRLPFATNTFDVITAMDIVEHIGDDKAAMQEICRVLKPGGRVFITVPAYRSLWSEHDEALHHFRRYTAPQVKDLAHRTGLTVERLTYTVTSLFPAIWLYRQISNRIPKKRAPGEKRADIVQVPAPVNSALLKLLRLENVAARSVKFPFGLTVVCVARKDEPEKKRTAE